MRNALNQVTSTVYSSGGGITEVTDARGFTSTTSFDSSTREREVIDAETGSHISRYDSLGNVIEELDPLGNSTKFFYDAYNRRIKVTNALFDDYLYEYDVAGNLLSEEDPAHHVTHYEYDRLGRKTTSTDALSNNHEYTYDVSGNVLTVTDPLDHVVTYAYDGLNRKTNETQPDPDGSGPLVSAVTRYEYDPAGNLTKRIEIVDGTSTPAVERITDYVYDEVNRLIREILPDPDGSGSLDAPVTEYGYDESGNRLYLIDPVGNLTQWEYDALNRVTLETNTLQQTRHFRYDAVGNLIEYTDRNNRVTTYDYDDANRRLHEYWLDGSGDPIRTVTTVYNVAGMVTSVSDPSSAITYSDFDDLNRPHTIANQIALLNQTATISQDFDEVGNRDAMSVDIDGDGFANEYTYDELNRVDHILQSGQGIAYKLIDYDYDDAGRLEHLKRFTGSGGTQLVVDAVYGYDDADRLTGLTYNDPSSTALADYTWVYDVTNRITSFESATDGTNTYEYDETDQLTAADSDYQDDETHSYDENGNRTDSGYDVESNNLTKSDGTYTYLYDDEGNRIARFVDAQSSGTGHGELSTDDTEITEYEWDHRNRLTKITSRDEYGGDATKLVEYTYDPLNRRIAKTIDGDGDGSGTADSTFFIHDGDRAARDGAGDQIILQLDDDGDITHRYLQGSAVDQILADEADAGDVLWPLADNLGTVRDLVQYTSSPSATTVANHITYDSFGKVTSETHDTVDHIFGFTGRELDDESGLSYYRARYYDSAIGQFVNEDPIGFDAGDSNLRRYLSNSPIASIDPSGLVEWGTQTWDWYQALAILRALEGDNSNGVSYANAVRDRALPSAGSFDQKEPRYGIGRGPKGENPDFYVEFPAGWTTQQVVRYALTDQKFRDRVEEAHVWGTTHPSGSKSKDPSTEYRQQQIDNLKKAMVEIDGLLTNTVRNLPGGEAAIVIRRASDGTLNLYIDELHHIVVQLPSDAAQAARDNPGKASIILAEALATAYILRGKKVARVADDAPKARKGESHFVEFNKTHKGSLPQPKGIGPNGGRLQSHHGLQQQWAKENLAKYGYDADLAPTITVETGIGHPHTAISAAQNARRNARVAAGRGKWSSSLQDELRYIVDDFTAAGYSRSTIKDVLEQQYKMLDKLGVPYSRVSF